MHRVQRSLPCFVAGRLLVLLVGSLACAFAAGIPANWRDIATGAIIPDEDYADQPYLVKCDDGAWLCVITTAGGHEGASSQHIAATRSTDFGRTWSPLIPIEPSGPPESSYVTALKTSAGRIYAFYNYNRDNLRAVKRTDGKMEPRVDTLGAFVFKYSDDHGKTWSVQRHEIPIRETTIDRENVHGGKVRFFWHVGRPLVHGGAAYVTLHKVGGFGPTFIDRSEGFFLRSDNLLTESDPQKIRWETLPAGDHGLRAPLGPIAEEQSIVALYGGGRRQFGWARFPRELRTVSFGDKLMLAPRFQGEMRQVRIYDRALRTSEIVGNWRHDADAR